MIGCLSVQNNKPVMKYLCFLYRQIWILRIEIGNIRICQSCTCICIYLDIYAGILLRQDVQSVNIHVSVDQNNLLLCFLNNRGNQAEGIIDLPIKEYFLLRFSMILNILEYFIKSLIGALLVLKLYRCSSGIEAV